MRSKDEMVSIGFHGISCDYDSIRNDFRSTLSKRKQSSLIKDKHLSGNTT